MSCEKKDLLNKITYLINNFIVDQKYKFNFKFLYGHEKT